MMWNSKPKVCSAMAMMSTTYTNGIKLAAVEGEDVQVGVRKGQHRTVRVWRDVLDGGEDGFLQAGEQRLLVRHRRVRRLGKLANDGVEEAQDVAVTQQRHAEDGEVDGVEQGHDLGKKHLEPRGDFLGVVP